MRAGLIKKRPFKAMYLCTNCGTLHQEQVQATQCCPGEQVFLCGRRKRQRPFGGYAVCFHFEKADAKRCRYGKKTDDCMSR